MTTITASVRFDPSVETREPDEAASSASANDAFRQIGEIAAADYGHAVRSVHAKSHALIEGELRVLDDLPADLSQGLFAHAATYPVVMRFSTNPGDVLPDSISVPRGLAVKVIGVVGERLPGSENDGTQDFVMANGPAFLAPSAADFVGSLKTLARTTDRGEALKVALSATLRAAETVIEAAGGTSAQIKNLGGHKQTHPLGETYYSQAAFRYGDAVAKFSVAPVSPDLTALTGTIVDVSGKPDGLRDALTDHFCRRGGTWELRVQLRTDPETMPVEDPSVPWPEDRSPYIAVARITAAAQPAWNEARAVAVDDRMLFTPWHGLAAHRPLGALNRLRRSAYEQSGTYRRQYNGCPMHEPHTPPDLAESTPPRPIARTRARSAAIPFDKAASRELGTLGPIAAGVSGGLAGGLLTSAMLLAMEFRTKVPSDLVKLERRSADKLGQPHPPENSRPAPAEHLISQGGHFALSAVAGAAYGALKPAGTSPLLGGLVLGTAFYGLAYGITGPALGLTKPLNRDAPASIAQHAAIHLLFGLAVAFVADRLERPPRP